MQQPRSSGSSGAAGGIARRGEPRPEAAVKSYYYVWACERRRHSADDSRRRPFFSPFLSCVSCAEPLTGADGDAPLPTCTPRGETRVYTQTTVVSVPTDTCRTPHGCFAPLMTCSRCIR